jgi:hypothetical protein
MVSSFMVSGFMVSGVVVVVVGPVGPACRQL